jgi:hypothetical protein
VDAATTANVVVRINDADVSRFLYPTRYMRGSDGMYPVVAGDVVTVTLSAAIASPGNTYLQVVFFPTK